MQALLFPLVTENINKTKEELMKREIELGCFIPLGFSAAGGMGLAAQVVLKRLENLISIKYDTSYTMTLNWLRWRLIKLLST